MEENKLSTISNLFEEKEIRSIWDGEKGDYYFCVVDVIGVLTNNDYQKSRNYWKWLKIKLNDEGSELVSNTNQLKLRVQDGKMRNTDVLDTKGILRLIESIPSPKAEPMKMWLANLGSEKIDEVQFQICLKGKKLEVFGMKKREIIIFVLPKLLNDFSKNIVYLCY